MTNQSLSAAKIGLSTRLRRGIASSFIFQMLTASESLVFVPLFLRAWGGDKYGHWLTLTALIAYLMLLNLGAQNYIGNLLTITYARRDYDTYRKYLSQVLSLFISICTIVILLVIVYLSLPNATVPGIGHTFTVDDKLIVVFLGSSYMISIVGGIWATAYRSTGSFARGVMVGNIIYVVRLLILGLCLMFHLSPTGYALIYFVVVLCTFLIFIWDINHSIPEARGVEISLANALNGRKHLGGSIWFWLIALAGGVNQQGLISVLAMNATTTVVASFSTHRTITGVMRYPANLLLSPLWSELSILVGENRYDELRRVFLFAVRVVTLSTGLILLALWSWIPIIYPLWTGNNLSIDFSLFLILAIQLFLFAGWSTSGWPLLAANQHRYIAVADIANAILTIVLATILATPFGHIGVAIASLIGDITFGAIMYPQLTANFLKISVWMIYWSFLRSSLSLLPLLVISFIVNRLFQSGEFAILMTIIGTVLFYPTLYLALGQHDASRIKRYVFQQIMVQYRSIIFKSRDKLS